MFVRGGWVFVQACAVGLVLQGCSTAKVADTPKEPVAQNAPERTPASGAYVIQNFPILEAIEAPEGQGQKLADETKEWMEKWRGMDLEDGSAYRMVELSGSTSINLKIQKIDPSSQKGYKSWGSFVPYNGAGNPNNEIASFNLAAIVGYDHIYRPAARYELGPKASQTFKGLINNATIRGSDRQENRTSILGEISTGNPLRGCVKAKKPDSVFALDVMASPSTPPNGAPKSSHPIIASLQASNPKPKAGTAITLSRGYVGDALELAREYSVIMTIDAVMQQWDRYSGGNAQIRKDDEGNAHFYAGDNGGAGMDKGTGWVERNLGWFSRYDRRVIERFQELYDFLETPSKGFLGYTDPVKFVTDLGLYYRVKPEIYAERLKRNIGLLLARVRAVKAKHGDAAYLD